MSRIILTDPRVPPPETVDPHTVARFYLDKFADKGKRTWVYKRGNPPYKPTSTKSLTTAARFYEYRTSKDEVTQSLEDWLQKIETKAARNYWKVQGGLQLTNEGTASWAYFIASLFLRTTKWRKQMVIDRQPAFAAQQLSDENVLRLQADLTKIGEFRTTQVLRSKIESSNKRFASDPASQHLPFFKRSVTNLANILLYKPWFVVEPAEGTSFVTSDAPVCTYRLDSGGQLFAGYGFGRQDSFAYLPLTPTKAWIAAPHKTSLPKVMDLQSTATMNRLSISFAERMVFSHERDDRLVSEADQFIGSTHFGQNAFIDSSAQA